MSSTEYKRGTIAVWDEIAPRYHKRWVSRDDGQFSVGRQMMRLSGIGRESRVLDVACGTGSLTARIRSRLGSGGLLVGVDISAAALNIAQGEVRGGSNVHFALMDAERISFAALFDVVTCQYALFFFRDALGALRSMREHLAKGGKIVAAVHGMEVPFFTSINEAVSEFVDDFAIEGAPRFERFSKRGPLERQLERAGFSGIRTEEERFVYSPGTFEEYWRGFREYIAKPHRAKLDALSYSRIRELKELAKENAAPYMQDDGTLAFPWNVLIVSGEN